MSKNSEAKAEAKAEMEKCLQSALQRVVSLEQQKFVPQLDHILVLANQKEQILASQIFVRKELHHPARDDEGISATAEKNQLYLAIDDRQSALINHKIIKDALHSAALNIQIQEAVRDGLQKVNVDNLMDHYTDRGVFLAHCSRNLHACKELASIVEQKTDLDKEIFQLHTKYSSILKEMRPKWEALQDRVMQVQEESQALVQLREKARERESRVQLLVTMIQGLVSTCGFQWSAYQYFVQVMLLCDSVVMHQDTAKQNAIMKEISRIHDDKENKENSSRLKEMLSASRAAK